MKKIFKLTLVSLVLFASSYSTGTAQTSAAVQKTIEQANIRFVRWFNSGKADSIAAQYHTDACISGRGCGKTFILDYYKSETGKYKFNELKTLTVTVKEKLATEIGQWKIILPNGTPLSGKYSTDWEKVNNKWVILKETVLE